jgi:glycosyltransferase involved in cell wall biosynthesis
MARRYKLAVLNSHPIQYFAPLYRYIAAADDIDLTVYYCSRQGLDAYIDAGFGTQVQWDIDLLAGYRAVFLPNLRRVGRMAGFFSLINPAIIAELRRGRFDALWVHGHNYLTYHLAIAAARLFGIPLWMRCDTHLGLSRSALKSRLRRPLLTLFYRQFAGLLAIGSRNADFYRHHRVPESRIFPAPYSVDNDHFMAQSAAARPHRADLRAEHGIAPDSVVILYASKLSARKHPLHLLRAYHAIRDRGCPAELVFVGSGTEEGALRQYAADHDLPGVHWLGFRNQSELPALYAMSDIFVLPAADEPWGLVINEVMCAGLPVIASAEIGAVADLVQPGANGYTFPVGAVDQLSAHLETLCGDADLRVRMGAASRAIIARWSYAETLAGIRTALAGTAS